MKALLKFVVTWLGVFAAILVISSFFLTRQLITVTAQGSVCDRTDYGYLDSLIPPGPTPIESLQPLPSTLNQVFDDEAAKRNIATWVLKAIAKKESSWRQIDNTYPNTSNNSDCTGSLDGNTIGCTCVSPGGAYGIMQVYWPVHYGNPGWDWDKVLNDYGYNIQRGADILVETSPPEVNTGNLSNIGRPINWYLKLWSYNSFSINNNPSNPAYNQDRNWEGNSRINCSNWPKRGLSERDYTYQERILYRAWCQSNIDGFRWPAIGEFPLPDDDLFAGINVPAQDILIFDVQASSACSGQAATFHYALNTSRYVTTQITIRDGKPWQNGQLIKTLPPGVNAWDGTNNAGQPVTEGTYWFIVAVSNSSHHLVGQQSGPVRAGCDRLYLPFILKSEASTPVDCTWSIDNLLTNGDFSRQLDDWTVWIDENDFDVHRLYDYDHSDPGNSAPGAFLGGENDDYQPPGGDFVDQSISQEVQLPDNAKAIALEYSSCLETEEPTAVSQYDKFLVDLQQPLGGESLLSQPGRYTNLDAAVTGCLRDSGNWQRMSLDKDMAEPYAGQLVTVVFYSDVDGAFSTTFYFDAVKLKVCTTG